jgi:prepilin-type N-terminal cleavage/methylation domain-containing protein
MDTPSQQGFSLIELLIVLVIIGILSSLAIPSYNKYVLRAHVIDLLTVAQPIKLAVSEALFRNQTLENINNATLRLTPIENQYKIKKISVEDGVIHIAAHPQKIGLPNDVETLIKITPHLNETLIHWTCKATPAELEAALPPNCS